MSISLTRNVFTIYRPMLTDNGVRWAVIATVGLVLMIGLWALGVTVVKEPLSEKLAFAGFLLTCATILTVSSVLIPRFALPLTIVSDLCLSVLQVAAVTSVFAPLTYIAAAQGFPLLDADLARLDLLLFGFEWNTATQWVINHPALNWVLVEAYCSIPYQIAGLLIISSIDRPGTQASELIWQSCISITLMTIIYIFTPALGNVGYIGTEQIDMLMQIRQGLWTKLDYNNLPGIISFPSFHTALGVMFIYAARQRLWTLAIFVPLNLIMIGATPTVGGHYLIDLPAGAAVAFVAIAVTRLLQRRLLGVPL